MNLRPYRNAADLESVRAILSAGRKAAGPAYYYRFGVWDRINRIFRISQRQKLVRFQAARQRKEKILFIL